MIFREVWDGLLRDEGESIVGYGVLAMEILEQEGVMGCTSRERA